MFVFSKKTSNKGKIKTSNLFSCQRKSQSDLSFKNSFKGVFNVFLSDSLNKKNVALKKMFGPRLL